MLSNLILASSSKYRKTLLDRLKIPFDVKVSGIDETPRSNETPGVLVKRLALEKANVIATNHPGKWVIGCDQIAQLDKQVLGKPESEQIAFKQLKKCSGREMQFITGVALVNAAQNKALYADSIVNVKFLNLSEDQIRHYLLIDTPYDCAGSFKVEAMGIALFEWVKSDDPTSLEGLPLITLCQLLRQAGIEPLAT